jgi:hypothetical protein
MTTATLAPSFNASPATADLDNLTAGELYDALESWQLQLSIHGRGRSESAYQFKAVAKPAIRRIKRELRSRRMPATRSNWLADAEQRLADAQDERATRRSDRGIQ